MSNKNMSNKNQSEEELKNSQATEQTESTIKNEETEGKAEKEEKSTDEKLAEALDKNAELQDKYLRQVAEFDNYRKRTIKEKTELILNGGEKAITSFLPIIDDMERALANIEKGGDIEALLEGVNLIYQKMIKVLESQGLKKIETEGKDFDTDYHEAIAMIPTEDAAQKGKIIDCTKTGYTLNDKVIRHSQVAVGQ